ncbi:MAG: PDZ domain-containing protein [Dehalococcoidia bacterium]|jgi:hypothetical protein|nr:PDZ domain-containing protein [Dehalococcoidia bacterium]
MTTDGTPRASWLSRNQWPLVVGAVALVALLGWALVAIDQFSDDEDDFGQQVTERSPGTGDRFRFDGSGFQSNGVVLGVLFAEFDELVVAEVTPGMPADEAGLRRDDEIREVDGERVRDVDELREAIWEIAPGDEYELTIERGGDELTLDVRRLEPFVTNERNGRQQAIPGSAPGNGGQGFNFHRGNGRQPAGPDVFDSSRLRPTLGVSVVQTSDGLQVMAVLPGSAAAEAGFREGDVITKVERDRVRTIDQLHEALPVFDLSGDEPPDEVGSAVEFTVLRDGRERELDVVFSIRPGELFPIVPPGTAQSPGAPEIPQEVVEQVVERLLMRLSEQIESDSFSRQTDELVEQLMMRLFADLEGDAVSGLGQQVVDQVLARLFADLDELDASGQLADATVYSGSVSELGDASIVLTGVRGPIRLTITNATLFVGGAAQVGGVASVVADENLNAVLVVVAG